MLYLDNYYVLSIVLSEVLKAAHWAITFVMVLKNPGIVSSARMTVMPDVNQKDRFRRANSCEPCKIISTKTEHCDRCDVCFEEVDHHCPWMNKCVAKGNLKEFYIFLGLTFGSLFYALGISLSKASL